MVSNRQANMGAIIISNIIEIRVTHPTMLCVFTTSCIGFNSQRHTQKSIRGCRPKANGCCSSTSKAMANHGRRGSSLSPTTGWQGQRRHRQGTSISHPKLCFDIGVHGQFEREWPGFPGISAVGVGTWDIIAGAATRCNIWKGAEASLIGKTRHVQIKDPGSLMEN